MLCMVSANQRRRYIVTSPIIGWAHTQNDPAHWILDEQMELLLINAMFKRVFLLRRFFLEKINSVSINFPWNTFFEPNQQNARFDLGNGLTPTSRSVITLVRPGDAYMRQ